MIGSVVKHPRACKASGKYHRYSEKVNWLLLVSPGLLRMLKFNIGNGRQVRLFALPWLHLKVKEVYELKNELREINMWLMIYLKKMLAAERNVVKGIVIASIALLLLVLI